MAKVDHTSVQVGLRFRRAVRRSITTTPAPAVRRRAYYLVSDQIEAVVNDKPSEVVESLSSWEAVTEEMVSADREE